MEILQHILVYLVLAIAVAYLLKKFVLPKSLFATKKGVGKACGEDDCACH